MKTKGIRVFKQAAGHCSQSSRTESQIELKMRSICIESDHMDFAVVAEEYLCHKI
jgi:hypothetical protein